MSVAKDLSKAEHVPSRDLLLKYFTPQSIQQVFTSLSIYSDDEHESISREAVPLFLQIITIVWKLRGEGGDSESGLTADVLLEEFQRTCQLPSSTAFSYARSTVEALLTLEMEDFLIRSIERPFKILRQSITQEGQASPFHPYKVCSPLELSIPSTKTKGKEKKKKETSFDPQSFDNCTALSLAAAIELMAALTSSDSRRTATDNDYKIRIDGIFSIVRDVVDVLYRSEADNIEYLPLTDDHEGGLGIDKLLVRCMNLLAIHSLQQAFDINEIEDSSSPSTVPVEELLSWVTVILLPLISTPHTVTVGSSSSSDAAIRRRVISVMHMVESVLLVISDALVMNLATNEICSSLLKILDILCSGTNENAEWHFHSIPREALKSVLIRMVNTLLKTSEGSKINEHLKKYLLILDNTDKENDSHKGDMNVQPDEAFLIGNEFQRLEV
jgi:hypothetical protein